MYIAGINKEGMTAGFISKECDTIKEAREFLVQEMKVQNVVCLLSFNNENPTFEVKIDGVTYYIEEN